MLDGNFFRMTIPIISLRKTSRDACNKISEYGFKIASKRKKKKVTIVHKSNVLRKSDRLFIETAKEIAKKYPDSTGRGNVCGCMFYGIDKKSKPI